MTSTSLMRRTVREALLASLREAAAHNLMDVEPPAAVLWPDEVAQWSTAVPSLRRSLRLITLGEYDESNGVGPAPWIRLKVRELVDAGETPVVYLPGVSRRTLMDAQSLPPDLQCLAGLAVRSAVWSQQNSTDWTPYAYFSNVAKGLGLDVAGDADTRAALSASLATLLDTLLPDLRGKRLDATAIHGMQLLDPARSVLKWLDNPPAFEAAERAAGTWDAFAHTLRATWGVSATEDGPLVAAQKLGSRAGKWGEVWGRFVDSPDAYSGIPDLLRRSSPGTLPDPLVWPQDNDDAEETVRARLASAVTLLPDEVRSVIVELDRDHGARRDGVWGRLGAAPMAFVVGHLAELARLSASQPVGSSAEALASEYADHGWQTDNVFLHVLSALSPADPSLHHVSDVAEALYRPWLNNLAAVFQKAWVNDPGWDGPDAGVGPEAPAGTCAMFVDGLRLDVAHRAAQRLTEVGLEVDLAWGKAGVPTVTSTCKPDLTPVRSQLGGGSDLTPKFADAKPWTQDNFKKHLADAGWRFVAQDETGDPSVRGWTEGGDIDTVGHNLGAKLARHLDSEVTSIVNRISELLAAGWREVVLITDHGWLLLPGRLPKHPLAEHLTQVRKGRCARMKAGALVPEGIPTLPWTFDAEAVIALAPAIYAFEDGKVYEHGGLSPQESVVPRLTVHAPSKDSPGAISVEISWASLACVVEVEGAPEGAHVDLRSKPADAGSTLAGGGKQLKDGRARILASDEHEGEAAVVVVVDAHGEVVVQRPTVVGEE